VALVVNGGSGEADVGLNAKHTSALNELSGFAAVQRAKGSTLSVAKVSAQPRGCETTSEKENG
jgi:hypothetical protein